METRPHQTAETVAAGLEELGKRLDTALAELRGQFSASLGDFRERCAADERVMGGVADREATLQRQVTRVAQEATNFERHVTAIMHRIEAIERKLDDAEARDAEVKAKSETLKAAEANWRPLLEARGDVVLRNDVGEVATIPIPVAKLIAAGRALDVALDTSDPGALKLLDGKGTVVARLPRSLVVCLEHSLESWAAE